VAGFYRARIPEFWNAVLVPKFYVAQQDTTIDVVPVGFLNPVTS